MGVFPWLYYLPFKKDEFQLSVSPHKAAFDIEPMPRTIFVELAAPNSATQNPNKKKG